MENVHRRDEKKERLGRHVKEAIVPFVPFIATIGKDKGQPCKLTMQRG